MKHLKLYEEFEDFGEWDDDDFDEEEFDIPEGIKYKSNKTWFRNFEKENYESELKLINKAIRYWENEEVHPTLEVTKEKMIFVLKERLSLLKNHFKN